MKNLNEGYLFGRIKKCCFDVSQGAGDSAIWECAREIREKNKRDNKKKKKDKKKI